MKNIKKEPNNDKPNVIKFGRRSVSNQNFSKMVALPKTALANCNCDMDKDLQVEVELVTEGNEKYLKLIPVCNTQEEQQKEKEKK